jgi:hypothetical protein
MSYTFAIDNTEPVHRREHFADPEGGHPPKMKHFTEEKRWKDLPGETVHASDTKTIGGPSPLFNAVSHAFNQHYPLVVTPDSVWLTILNGLVHHIDTDPKGLRHHFVEHEGKLLLEVKVASPPLPNVPPEVWEYGVEKFSAQLMKHIGKKADLIVCDFSTTEETDRLSSQIAMMGAMKHFFEYKMYLLCGLNKATVTGTPEDWSNIHDRVHALSEFGLSWWTDRLEPIILELKRSCEGNPDVDFWRRIYLEHRVGSGSQYKVSGWVNAFYPYITASKGQMKRNPCVDWESGEAVEDDDFPSGLVSAPVLLDDHGTEYNFKFYGGLVGVAMDEDFSVQAKSGWAIQNLGKKK